jgi:RNA polymerase sigma-70 factor (ECF subfamily)
LPEPIAAGEDPAEVAELADSVSMAMLVVLETLTPLERATFVLREVFDLPFSEIGDTLGRSESAVRQLAHRAREHVHARQPRQQVDKARHTQVTQEFLAATWSGDLDQVVSLLAPDVVLVSDGGGKRKAALRPLLGADKVARWLLGLFQTDPQIATFDIRLAEVNGEQAVIAYDGELVDSVAFLELDADDVISRIYVVRNPDKLLAIPSLT